MCVFVYIIYEAFILFLSLLKFKLYGILRDTKEIVLYIIDLRCVLNWNLSAYRNTRWEVFKYTP